MFYIFLIYFNFVLIKFYNYYYLIIFIIDIVSNYSNIIIMVY